MFSSPSLLPLYTPYPLPEKKKGDGEGREESGERGRGKEECKGANEREIQRGARHGTGAGALASIDS